MPGVRIIYPLAYGSFALPIRSRPHSGVGPVVTNGCCCELMRQNSTLSCGYHDEEWGCPDVLVVHTSSGLALPTRDGGGSYSPISFCPWCGARLPEGPKSRHHLMG